MCRCPVVRDDTFEFVAIHCGSGPVNATTGNIHHNRGVNINRNEIWNFLFSGFHAEPGGGFEAVTPDGGFEVVGSPGNGESPDEILDAE